MGLGPHLGLPRVLGWVDRRGPQTTWDDDSQLKRTPVLAGRDLRGIPAYAAILLFIVQCAFYLLLVIMLAALIVWLIALVRAPKAWRPALGAAYGAALVQLGLWLLIIPPLVMIGVRTSLTSPGAADQINALLRNVQGSFVLHLAFTVAIGSVAFSVWLHRLRWASTRPFLKNPAPYTYPTPPPDIARLLVHASIVGGLVVLGALGSTLSLVGLVRRLMGLPPLFELSAGLVASVTSLFVSVLLLASALLVRGLRDWLHIITDVINHFYRRRDPLPLPVGPEDRVKVHDFETQQRIESRFKTALLALLDDPEVTHLTVMAHSQGTMIAVDVFSMTGLAGDFRRQLTARLKQLRQFHLVTMGSPLTHLYQHYFPFRYPPLSHRAWGRLKSTIKNWVNVYRVDDFIGTFVEPPTKAWVTSPGGPPLPVNLPIEPGGHTGYWRQPPVFNLHGVRDALPG